MNRRAFLSTLSGSLLAAPLAAEAQRAREILRVGYAGVAAVRATGRRSGGGSSSLLGGRRPRLGGYVTGRGPRVG
jgi:hypothetical protein